jgi:hypothetical protein
MVLKGEDWLDELEGIPEPSVKAGRASDAPGWMRSEGFMSIAAKSGVASPFHIVCPRVRFHRRRTAGIYQDHCQMCFQEDRPVRLKCWPVEEEVPRTLRTLVTASWNALPRRQLPRHRGGALLEFEECARAFDQKDLLCGTSRCAMRRRMGRRVPRTPNCVATDRGPDSRFAKNRPRPVALVTCSAAQLLWVLLSCG